MMCCRLRFARMFVSNAPPAGGACGGSAMTTSLFAESCPTRSATDTVGTAGIGTGGGAFSQKGISPSLQVTISLALASTCSSGIWPVGSAAVSGICASDMYSAPSAVCSLSSWMAFSMLPFPRGRSSSGGISITVVHCIYFRQLSAEHLAVTCLLTNGFEPVDLFLEQVGYQGCALASVKIAHVVTTVHSLCGNRRIERVIMVNVQYIANARESADIRRVIIVHCAFDDLDPFELAFRRPGH